MSDQQFMLCFLTQLQISSFTYHFIQQEILANFLGRYFVILIHLLFCLTIRRTV